MDLIMTGVEFFHRGGSIMYVLLLCSFLVVSIAVERWRYFARRDSGRSFTRQFAEAMSAGDFDRAVSLAKSSSGDLPELLAGSFKIISEGAEHDQLAGYMEVQSGVALSRLRQRLYYLSVIVTMAPLLGLLGTIGGMISAFSVFNVEAGQATAITGGVGEALIATAMGLCVAIIALAVHSYFTQRLENIITDMEQCFSLVEASRKALLDKAGNMSDMDKAGEAV
ncbi:MotA/TolQ/ExbB proton channel family protein [Anaerovibrio sp.]|uniref:MotA/TolQ/ExbB proton channel family protein n=1 Tax=Anaerovibrio sp. TaxID=1872532 RepID=UPI003F18CBEA